MLEIKENQELNVENLLSYSTDTDGMMLGSKHRIFYVCLFIRTLKI